MAISLVDSVKDLKIIMTNGTTLIGKYEKTDVGYKIISPVPYEDGDLDAAITEWIAKGIEGTHSNIDFEGNGISIATKSFSEDQVLSATILAMKAERAANTAVAGLQADAVRDIY